MRCVTLLNHLTELADNSTSPPQAQVFATNADMDRDILYINDAQNSKNTIYKYDLDLGAYIDTIVVDSPVKDIAFY